jgi:glycosyl transferase family 25
MTNAPSARLLDIPMFFINMERSANRRIRLQQHLVAQRLSATHFPALDGGRMSALAVKEAQHSFWPIVTSGSRLFNGQVACALSHLSLARILIERDLDLAFVLEDDARIKADELSDIVDNLQVMPRGWDVLLLTFMNNSYPYVVSALGPRHTLFGILGDIDSAAGYLITQSGAKKLSQQKKLEAAADSWSWFSVRQRLNVYGVWPMPIFTDQSGGSEIGLTSPGTAQKTSYIFRKVVKPIRRVITRAILGHRAVHIVGCRRPPVFGAARATRRVYGHARIS